jgi:hypothetical protein
MPETNKEKHGVANLLNANHRRAISTVLRRIELATWRLEEQIIQQMPPQLVLTRFTNPVDARQKAALLQLIRQVRQEIAELALDYNLEVGETDLLRSIMAEFTLLWGDLEDIRPQKLRRYGTINPQADEILGPPIERLIELMLTIDSVASGK